MKMCTLWNGFSLQIKTEWSSSDVWLNLLPDISNWPNKIELNCLTTAEEISKANAVAARKKDKQRWTLQVWDEPTSSTQCWKQQQMWLQTTGQCISERKWISEDHRCAISSTQGIKQKLKRVDIDYSDRQVHGEESAPLNLTFRCNILFMFSCIMFDFNVYVAGNTNRN